MGSIETETINEMIIGVHQLTRNPLYIHQDDDIWCYDRIICNHAILCSRKFEILDNICILHCHTHGIMIFKN